ncbi:hypothetical protein FHR22_002795 [Sphingopyxis panaciterrae]|uniref:hypothetical protein n=1 Tax=Sphingopyxis panaciterrae TaxID=363841 RepID=UPI0014242118|nr:hypothetical protein [Sphingopyxis panaciterrae]NIJ38092.1 hypothetical protein [Sphingopyxis panaciterrae]
MDRADRRVRRGFPIAAVALLGLAAAGWAVLPDGRLARVERRADCTDPAKLPPVETLADGRQAMRLRVLLWNVEGLPWPIRSGREVKLAQIADWIAARRAAGRGPDILILHKAFVPEASRIAVVGGFGSIVPGPALDQRRRLPAAEAPIGYADGARWRKGEGLGKWLDGGLYIATDLPVLAAQSEAFGADSCAGYDCLSNKGGLVLRVAVPGAPERLTIFNTHRNSREPAKVGIARAEASHRLQTAENDALLAATTPPRSAMIAAGDFNNYRAGDRIGRFANDPAFRLAAKGAGMSARAAPMTDQKAWTDAYDLLGFRSSSALRVEPLAVATLFDGKNGPRLSDHDAQYIVFRLSWRGDAAALPATTPRCPS